MTPRSFLTLALSVTWLLASATVTATLALTGCSSDEGAILSGERVIGSLLTYEDRREVLHENEERPVRVRLIKPRQRDKGSHELLPALEMAAPAKVAIQIPAMGVGATLEFATGFDSREWANSGTVHFRAIFDGETLIDERRLLGEQVPYEERSWNHVRTDVAGGGELVLETSYEGSSVRPVLSGFGPLHIVSGYEMTRELATPDKPSVILVLIDTLRADRLHTYGNPAEVSPNMDALAARGTLFEAAYSATPWTPPSTASVLTGFSPPAHGLAGTSTQYLSEELTTLPERFLDAGFDTAGFSSNPLIVKSRNFDQGFRSFSEYEWADMTVFFGEVQSWIEAQGQHRFFLYLQLVEPHDPYKPAPDYEERFAGTAPEGLEEENLRAFIARADRLGPDNLDELQARNQRNLALYDAEIATVDRQLGQLFDVLNRLGHTERTVIAVTSDHGEEFLEHGMVCHSIQLYDESVRVPLFLAGPGVPVAKRIADRVPNRLIGSTLLQLAGLAPGSFPAGPNILESVPEDPVFVTTGRGVMYDRDTKKWVRAGEVHGIRSGRWYFDWSPAQGEREKELFHLSDLLIDPESRTDVSAENREVVERLKGAISFWLESEKSQRPQLLREGRAEIDLLKAAGYAGGDE
ncbi:MAG: arylsulfatase A-like enzyme [Planctomycetota bacterium]|jgi:arylsulfatase A-like enzyme